MAYADVKDTVDIDGQTFPLDSAENCRKAWQVLHSGEHTKQEMAEGMAKIRAAGRGYGVSFPDEEDMRPGMMRDRLTAFIQTRDVSGDEHEEDYLADLLADMSDVEVAELADLADLETAETAEGSGERSRFSRLSHKLAGKGARNPDALAAWIGRRKYGRAGMAALAAKGRAKRKTRSGRLTSFLESRRLLEFDEALHPRDPEGSTTGGQFTSNPKSATTTKPPARKTTPAKKTAGTRQPGTQTVGSGVMSYDPKTGRGTGYGMAGGDPRVRRLQEMLNRLGVTDSRGRKLTVDGKLGPRTTQAVRAAQRRMGMSADGKVDAELLGQLSNAKSLPKKAKSKNCTCRSVECLDDTCDVVDGEFRRALPEVCTRAFEFESRAKGDGRTLEGYVAVFGSTARIADHGGDFDEEIHRGAFDQSLSRSLPVMQFDHGRDPRTGTVPIGVYDVFEPDHKGYRVRGRLLDNPVVEPVRQAIAEGAIRGMSWRMMVPKAGEKWTRRSGTPDKRDVIQANVPEAGPVVFPAYDTTTVSVRSFLSTLDVEARRALIHELWDELRAAYDLSELRGLDRDEDLTGRPTGDVGGGDPDPEPQQRARPDSPNETAATRHRELLITGVIRD